MKHTTSHLLVFALLTLAACQSATTPFEARISSSVNIVPPNSRNPHLYAAHLHNDALDYYIATADTFQLTQTQAENVLYQFLDDSITFVSPSYAEYSDSIIAHVGRTSTQEMLDEALTRDTINTMEHAIMTELVGIQDSLWSSYDSATYINRIHQVEDGINNNTFLSSDRKWRPLGLAAIMQGSFYYWNYQYNNLQSTLWAPNDLLNSKGSKRPSVLISERSKRIIDADVAGFLSGMLGSLVKAIVITLASGGLGAAPAVVDVLLEAGAGGAASSCVETLR